MDLETRVLEEGKRVLRQNRRIIGGHEVTIPAPGWFDHQYLWDSCFHAITLSHFDQAAAENELISLMASQHRNGMVPHSSKFNFRGMLLPYTSNITQPPLIARATLEVYEAAHNTAFLDNMFPKLNLYYEWLSKKRVREGVLTVASPLEAGEDNSVVWDDADSLRLPKASYILYDYFATHFPKTPQVRHVFSVKETALYADSLQCMSLIAGILGNNELSTRYERQHEKVIESMRKVFRHSSGLYYNLNSNGEPIIVKTHSIFAPLFAGALPKEEAETLIKEHLLNEKEFWPQFPVPTVAINEPKFSPTGYWRGPVWMPINWIIYSGLLRYGFNDAAQMLLLKTLVVVEKSGFREYYNPLTGEGLGAREFGMSTLPVDMVMRNGTK